MWLNPTGWKLCRKRRAPALADEISPLDDLLFRIEFSDDDDERAALTAELERMVEADGEVARVYEMHQFLERELRALFESGGSLGDQRRWSRVKRYFARLRCRLTPGPVG
jgi:hypothetical protein